MVDYIKSRAIGAAVPGINLGILKALPVMVPPMETQKRIAGLLGAYDDLIEVNRRRVDLLERMVRGLFEEWFIRFRFPGHEAPTADETSEALTLPVGWQTCLVGDLLEHSIGGLWGQAEQSVDQSIEIAVVRGTDFAKLMTGNTGTVPRRFVSDKDLKSRRIRESDILLEASGGGKDQPVGRVMFVSETLMDEVGGILAPASFCRLLRARNSTVLAPYLLGLLQRMYADGRIEKFQKQSTGLRNLSMSQLLAEKVVLPSEDILERYAKASSVALRTAAVYRAESARLAASRDLLLPRLMSGQLLLSDERKLEAA